MQESVIIIAEAGVNHNGSLALAKKLVEAAADAGADYVKFQTFKAENLVSKEAKKAGYQIKNLGDQKDVSQFNMLKSLELSYADHNALIEHCKEHNIAFLSTAFDLDSVAMLKGFGIDIWKIPSGEITNLPYLKLIAGFNQRVILSTGMASLSEIQDAVTVLINNGTSLSNITVLHCNTEYPTPFVDVNLLAMNKIAQVIQSAVGYSDHTLGIEVAIAATALGARVIEKHFTLDRQMPGPDHKASLEPDELKKMISSIRNIELALGDGEKKVSNSEFRNLEAVRKSIHLKNALPINHIIREVDIVMMRPGDGISPMKMYEVIGRKTKSQMNEGQKLSWSDIL